MKLPMKKDETIFRSGGKHCWVRRVCDKMVDHITMNVSIEANSLSSFQFKEENMFLVSTSEHFSSTQQCIRIGFPKCVVLQFESLRHEVIYRNMPISIE